MHPTISYNLPNARVTELRQQALSAMRKPAPPAGPAARKPP
jgi:hypothetical protein